MKLRYLSNTDSQYHEAGLNEAYHIVYYIPRDDVTNWTNRVLNFKNKTNIADYKAITDLCVEAMKQEQLNFDYVIRVMGHNETTPLMNAKIREFVLAITKATGATYLPQLLNKYRKTRPLHTLPTLSERQEEMRGVFFVKEETIDLNERTILIIDDISTSCTTVAEMIKTIKARWPLAIFYLFCFARTNHNPNANQNL